jgi:DNA-binding MarR family transcriptional regulator
MAASVAEATATLAAIQEQGYSDVSLAGTALLSNLDTNGCTVTALARRAGVTRQAASQQVAALERSGYVRRRGSDTDARAVIVIQTSRGRALLEHALIIVRGLEQGYASIIGAEQYATLKAILTQLLEQIDPSGTLRAE